MIKISRESAVIFDIKRFMIKWGNNWQTLLFPPHPLVIIDD